MSTASLNIEPPWTPDEFFAWHEQQGEKYELVDGFPLRMMTGASREHSRVTVNVIAALDRQLEGGPCEPHSSDLAVQTLPGQIRYPDASVECDPDEDARYEATQVRMVLEVLSPGTQRFDLQRKLVEYQRIERLEYILLVHPERLDVRLWHRGEAREWQERTFAAMDEVVDMPEIGAALSVANIYRRLDVPSDASQSSVA